MNHKFLMSIVIFFVSSSVSFTSDSSGGSSEDSSDGSSDGSSEKIQRSFSLPSSLRLFYNDNLETITELKQLHCIIEERKNTLKDMEKKWEKYDFIWTEFGKIEKGIKCEEINKYNINIKDLYNSEKIKSLPDKHDKNIRLIIYLKEEIEQLKKERLFLEQSLQTFK